MKNAIITVENVATGEYFFTTDHCQNHELGPSWVPCTCTLPMHVTPRESLPSGVITNKEEYKKVFAGPSWQPAVEIPNPNPEYQA